MRVKKFILFPKPISRSVRKFRRAHLSYTHDFEYYFDLDNSFQGGMFHKVRQLRMS